MVDFPGQPSISCGSLDQLADQSVLDEAQCGIIQGFVKEACSCKHPDDTKAPTSVPLEETSTQRPIGIASHAASQRSYAVVALAAVALLFCGVIAD